MFVDISDIETHMPDYIEVSATSGELPEGGKGEVDAF